MNTGAWLRLAGTVTGVLLGLATGVWDVFLSPLRAGGVPLPVSPLLAVLGNLGLVWFTYRVTGGKGLALLPGLAWFAIMVVGAGRTTEGDVPMPGNDYMGLLAVLLGAVAWGVGAYRLIVPRPARQAPAERGTGPDSARPARRSPAAPR